MLSKRDWRLKLGYEEGLRTRLCYASKIRKHGFMPDLWNGGGLRCAAIRAVLLQPLQDGGSREVVCGGLPHQRTAQTRPFRGIRVNRGRTTRFTSGLMKPSSSKMARTRSPQKPDSGTNRWSEQSSIRPCSHSGFDANQTPLRPGEANKSRSKATSWRFCRTL